MEQPSLICIEKTCNDLDQLIVKYFETFAELCDLKQQLECTMKDGFLYMAKARYSMGINSVTSLQYNENDLNFAMAHVDVETLSGTDAGQVQQFLPVFPSPQSQTSDKAQGDNSESPTKSEDISGLSSAISHLDIGFGVRKRKVPTAVAPENGAGDESSTNGPDQTSINSIEEIKSSEIIAHDPIRWFGVLVPLPLKQSQKAFRNGIELACKIASLQSLLIDIRQSYADLMQEKRRNMSHNSVPSAVEK